MLKLSLKVRLIATMMAITTFLLIVIGMGYYFMKSIYKEFHYVSTDVLNTVVLVGDLNEARQSQSRSVFQSYLAKDLTELKKYANDFSEDTQTMNRLLDTYRKKEFLPGERDILETLAIAHREFDQASMRYFKVMENDFSNPETKEKGYQLLYKDVTKARKGMSGSIKELIKFSQKVANEKTNSAISVYERSNLLTIILSIVGVILSIAVGIIISNKISKKFHEISEQILASSSETSIASNQLTSSSSSLSEGATESAASLEETVSSLEELTSMVNLNSDHAKEANSISQRSLDTAHKGNEEIVALIKSMAEMEKSSKKIEEIINVIDDIAFQTNLLALNAAVEAARAGEQGKGFAVVADAVRGLAQRSAVAAKDINTLIKENVGQTLQSSQIAQKSGSSLKEIVTAAKKVSDLNSEIAAASAEQANGIEQISKAMNHLDAAIQSNASSSQQVAGLATEMSSQANSLTNLVDDLRHFIEGKNQKLNTNLDRGES